MSIAEPKQARWLLIAGAVLLIATALFHSTGLSMVSDWLPGMRGQVLSLLWLTPVIDWFAVAIIWLIAAWRLQSELRLIVLVSAIVPAIAAVGLFMVAGTSHPGPFMLAGATMLAVLGAIRLR